MSAGSLAIAFVTLNPHSSSQRRYVEVGDEIKITLDAKARKQD